MKLQKMKHHSNMKTKREILFDHYRLDESGTPILNDDDILAAMEEYKKQAITNYKAKQARHEDNNCR